MPTLLPADWPQWRGENRNGVDLNSPSLLTELPAEGLQPLWINQKLGGEGWSSPVVSQGYVYFFSHAHGKDDTREEHVYCVQADSGTEAWRKTFASRATKVTQSGTPTVAGGRVYILGAGRLARCLDAASGEEVWSRQLPGDVNDEPWHASFAVADDMAIVFAGRLYGLKTDDGEVLWQGDDAAKEGVHGSPAVAAVAGERLVVAHVGQGETVAVEPKSGKQRWRIKTEAVASSPVIQGDLLLTLGQSRKGGLRCYRMSGESAELLWKHQTLADPGASPVALGDHVYAQGERKLTCVGLKDGEVAWSHDLPIEQPRYTSLLAADGQVFYAFDSLLAFAADPKQYRELYHGRFDKQGVLADEPTLRKKFELDDLLVSADVKAADKVWKEKLGDAGPYTCTSPAIADGRLFLRLRQGVACYDLRK